MATILVSAGVMFTVSAQTMINAQNQEAPEEIVNVDEEPIETEDAIAADEVVEEDNDVSIAEEDAAGPHVEAANEAETEKISDIFPDQSLAKLIGKELKKESPSEPVTQMELESITLLRSNGGKAIKSLAGVERLINLRTVELQNQKVTDLSPLQTLVQLQRLILTRNGITNIQPLQHLTQLQHLTLDMNQINDIRPLEHLTNIKELGLRHNQLTDITTLTRLQQITQLGLDGNQITDLAPLRSLSALLNLTLERNSVRDVRPLESLSNLRVLNLSQNNVTDISPLSKLGNLQKIALGKSRGSETENNITDFAILGRLPNLTELDVEGQDIGRIPEGVLTRISFLNARAGKLTDLTPFLSLPNLTTLLLGDNQFEDLSPLAGANLPNLRELDLAANYISDLSPLATAQLPALETLSLNNQKKKETSLLPHALEIILANPIKNINGAFIEPWDIFPAEQGAYEVERIVFNIPMPNGITKIGYKWSEEVQIGAVSSLFSGMHTVDVYEHYLVNFIVDDQVHESVSARPETLVAAPTQPTKPGYEFLGWFTEPVDGEQWDFTTDKTPANVLNLYAQFRGVTHTVTYNDIGNITLVEAHFGEKLIEPVVPPRTGYTFAGWFTEAIGGEAWDFAGRTMPDYDITLYAQYTQNVYTVVFDNEGQLSEPLPINYGETIQEPMPEPTKIGYTFLGWFTDKSEGDRWDFATDVMPATDIVLYARFQVNTYNLTYINEEEIDTVEVPFGTKLEDRHLLERAEYAFVGWFTDETDGERWNFEEWTMPAENMTLYARWQSTTRKLTTRGKDIEITKTEFLGIIEKQELEVELLNRSGVEVIDEDEEIVFHLGNADFIVSNLTDLIEVLGEGEYTVHLAYVDKTLAGDTSLSTEVKLTVLADSPTNPGGGSNTGGGDRLAQTGERTKEQLLFSGLLMLASLIMLLIGYLRKRSEREATFIEEPNKQ